MTTKITFSTRPEETEERVTVIAFDATIDLAKVPTVVAHPVERFRLASKEYTAARLASAAATAAAAKAAEALQTAESMFGTAFDRWTTSIDAANRTGFAAGELKPQLGDRSPSAFRGASARTQIGKMGPLLEYVAGTPALEGDPARLKALATASDVLTTALKASDAAKRIRAKAVRKAKTATTAFDKAWGKVVEEIQDFDPDGLVLQVPKFRRVSEEPTLATKEPSAEPKALPVTFAG